MCLKNVFFLMVNICYIKDVTKCEVFSSIIFFEYYNIHSIEQMTMNLFSSFRRPQENRSIQVSVWSQEEHL